MRHIIRGYQAARRIADTALQELKQDVGVENSHTLLLVAIAALMSKLASPQRDHIAALAVEVHCA